MVRSAGAPLFLLQVVVVVVVVVVVEQLVLVRAATPASPLLLPRQ